MTKKNFKNNQGASLIEYAFLIILILSAMWVMKDMISRGIFAKYRQSGESFGFGRQYDAKRTSVCRQDVKSYKDDGTVNEVSEFYDEDCYQTRVRRPASFNLEAPGTWNTEGGCPACDPGNTSDSKACFKCEDDIKKQCAVDHAYCLQ